MDNSPGLLAGVGAAVLVVVALGVFAIGGLFGGDDDAVSADGSDNGSASENLTSVDGQPVDDDGEGSGIDGNSGSSGNGSEDGSSDGESSDEDTDDESTDTTTDSDSDDDDDSATTESGGDSDFCEASTRNNFTFQFASGASSADQSNSINANEIDLHQLAVNQGQILTATVEADSTANVQIMSPNGTITSVTGTPYTETIAPTEAGNYQICIDPQGQVVTYTLTVSVINDTSPTKISAPWCGDSVNDRGEISFATGATSGTVEQAVIRGERDLYSFEAAAGQDLDLFMTSLEDNAEFSLRSPSGELIIDGVSDFRIPLPESGDYLICVVGTRGNASYSLTTTIE